MDNDKDKRKLANKKKEQEKLTSSRRDFLQKGAMGLAGVAGAYALGMQPAMAMPHSNYSDKRRVTILFDSWNHMMPALAREMVRRNHDLVLGDAQDMELVKELWMSSAALIPHVFVAELM